MRSLPTETGISHALVEFARSLRAHGVAVGTGQVTSYRAAAAALDITDLLDLYWAGRTCLLSKESDTAVYDAAFAEFFFGEIEVSEAGAEPVDVDQQLVSNEGSSPVESPSDLETDAADKDGDEEAGRHPHTGAVASLHEVLRKRSFADWSDEELAMLPVVLASIPLMVPTRRLRRTRAALQGASLDLRRTVRRSLRHEGELLRRAWRVRRHRPRDVVMLVDVSGSMKEHTRALLHFAYAMSTSRLNVEVFCFGTRVTRVTKLLRDRDPDRAVQATTATVTDWSGGTRIGESLSHFMRQWGRSGSVRGAVVLLFSDGLERGDPQLLATQMGRLGRLAHSVIWLNPLKADPSYEPLARGMAAALPFLDHFVAADTVEDLVQVTKLIRRIG